MRVRQDLGGRRDLKMARRCAHLARTVAPYAGNSGLDKPRDAEIDRAQNRTHDVRIAEEEEDEILLQMNGVADGIRTHDNRNHNPGLYQLSYSHHCTRRAPLPHASRSMNLGLDALEGRHPDLWRARQDSNLLPPA